MCKSLFQLFFENLVLRVTRANESSNVIIDSSRKRKASISNTLSRKVSSAVASSVESPLRHRGSTATSEVYRASRCFSFSTDDIAVSSSEITTTTPSEQVPDVAIEIGISSPSDELSAVPLSSGRKGEGGEGEKGRGGKGEEGKKRISASGGSRSSASSLQLPPNAEDVEGIEEDKYLKDAKNLVFVQCNEFCQRDFKKCMGALEKQIEYLEKGSKEDMKKVSITPKEGY